MSTPLIFDRDHYDSLNEARALQLRDVLPPVIKELALESAIDVGCGVGFFSDVLHSYGLKVAGVDGREANVAEARRRYPSIEFRHCDAEELTAETVGQFDLVFCYGLLYHLQNPFRVIRQLREMTNHMLLVEAVVYPGGEAIMGLIDEPPGEDQGLSHFAFYPTQQCLEKMFYRAGFSHVYRFTRLPQHQGYFDAPGKRKVRTVLAASLRPLSLSGLTLVEESKNPIRPWDPTSGLKGPTILNRVLRFTQLPTNEKIETLKRLLKIGQKTAE